MMDVRFFSRRFLNSGVRKDLSQKRRDGVLVDQEGTSPIVYRLPRDIIGEALATVHQQILARLQQSGWRGGIERRSSGVLLYADCITRRRFWFFRCKTLEFLLATIHDIDPKRMYKKGESVAFRLSDNEMVAPMGNVRWIDDVNDPVFQKLRPFWAQYTSALDAALQT